MPHTTKPETNEVQTAKAVDPAAICSAFPLAKQINANAGWTLDYATLEEIHETTECNEGGRISLEDIEIIVLALAERGFVMLTPNAKDQATAKPKL